MASANAQVFAVPELLEMILLNLDDVRELFVLQRISRTFRHILEESTALQRLMGLIHHKSPHSEQLLDNSSPFLQPGNMLAFGPYTRVFTCAFHDCPDEFYCEVWKSSMDISKDGEVLPELLLRPEWKETCGRWNHELGFKTNRVREAEGDDDDGEDDIQEEREEEREGQTFREGSWRNCMICLTPKPVRICIYVLLPEDMCHARGLNQFCYREDKKDPQGKMTLGELIGVLEEVRRRTDEEHFVRSEELGESVIARLRGPLG